MTDCLASNDWWEPYAALAYLSCREGWEKLGLYEYYKSKNAEKKRIKEEREAKRKADKKFKEEKEQ